MELTLKDQSVAQIGEAVQMAGTQMVKSKSGKEFDVKSPQGRMIMAYTEKMAGPFEQMMTTLEDIRNGIFQLVDKFSDSVSLQQDQIQAQEQAADLEQAGSGEDIGGFDDSGEEKVGFLEKGKEKAKAALGSFKSLLMKGGLIVGLIGLAKVLQKYGGVIAEFLATGWEKLKAGVQSIIDFFSITIPEKAKELKDAVVNFFTVTLPTKIEEIKTTLGEWFTSIKDGIADLFEKVKTFFTVTIPTKFAEIKVTVTEWFTSIKDGISDLFTKIKDFFIITIPTKFAEMKTIVTEWFDNIKTQVGEVFTKIKDFFVITIPEKVQLIKDSITVWFTNIVDEVKGIFTKVKDFFTITIPTKVQEIKDSITLWFTNIKDEVVGIFTKVKDFVMITIPTKIAEMTKSITDKVTSIKDEIVKFAMAPFNKIKELMQGLLVGVLESVENLPFIGDKAKAMKNKILGIDEGTASDMGEAGASVPTVTTESGTMPIITTNDSGDVIDTISGDKVKFGRNDEEGAAAYAAELSKMGQGKFEPYFETKGFNHYAVRKTGESITGQAQTTGGATGGEINSTSGELGSSTSDGSGGVVVGGTNNISTNSAVQHTSIDEKSGVSDQNVKNEIMD